MMPDEDWKSIHKQRWVYDPPTGPRLVAPPIRHPTCETHCSGHHLTDSHILCAHCGTTKYRVVLHEYAHSEGTYFNELVAMNGAAPYQGQADLICCGRNMHRR